MHFRILKTIATSGFLAALECTKSGLEKTWVFLKRGFLVFWVLKKIKVF